jgi:hypothetical protein
VLAFTALYADELKDLSSADVAPPVPATATDAQQVQADKDTADIGEGTGNFGGALMTSGSFTMMAAGAGYGEEEELGEGEGTGNFGGALMTSGSFTMMAAGAGYRL